VCAPRTRPVADESQPQPSTTAPESSATAACRANTLSWPVQWPQQQRLHRSLRNPALGLRRRRRRSQFPLDTHPSGDNALAERAKPATQGKYDATPPHWESRAPTAPPSASSAAFPSPSARRRRQPGPKTPIVTEEIATTAHQPALQSSRARSRPYTTPKMEHPRLPSRPNTLPSKLLTMAPMCNS